MSANLVIDLHATTVHQTSLPGGATVSPSGFIAGLSGRLVGDIVDMADAHVNTNVWVAAKTVTSGPLLVGVQTSPDTTSGNFTDPTSGLPSMPSWFNSGGWLIIGSGATPGFEGAGVSGRYLLSGGVGLAHFQRPHRYARLIVGSGFYDGAIQAGFIGQRQVIGSGGGYTLSPGSGSVSV